jgi:hypothetical protein
MKYICVEIEGLEQIIIFSKGIGHDEMAEKFKKILSAGFVSQDWKIYGESISLKIESRERDQLLLDIALNL